MIKKFGLNLLNIFETYTGIMLIITSLISAFVIYNSWREHITISMIQEKYNRMNTYDMNLSYDIWVDENSDNNDNSSDNIGLYEKIEDTSEVSFNEKISLPNQYGIIINPKLGGVKKIYNIYYQNGNIYNKTSFYGYEKDKITLNDASEGSIRLDILNLFITGEDEISYYSTMFLIIEDFKHNFYTNMIIFEINKNDPHKVNKRIYKEIDLLRAYNKSKSYLPDFDSERIHEYLDFKNQLNKILDN